MFLMVMGLPDRRFIDKPRVRFGVIGVFLAVFLSVSGFLAWVCGFGKYDYNRNNELHVRNFWAVRFAVWWARGIRTEVGGCARETATRQVIIYPGEDGFWVGECPSLPGCISQGGTKGDAIENIRDAIAIYLEALKEDVGGLWG